VPSTTAAFAWWTRRGSGGPSDHVHDAVSNTRTVATISDADWNPPST
jgi:hypothetical protein